MTEVYLPVLTRWMGKRVSLYRFKHCMVRMRAGMTRLRSVQSRPAEKLCSTLTVRCTPTSLPPSTPKTYRREEPSPCCTCSR